MRHAVTLLLLHDDKVLAISRGEDLEDWGLPGGKVELDDCCEETLEADECAEYCTFCQAPLTPKPQE